MSAMVNRFSLVMAHRSASTAAQHAVDALSEHMARLGSDRDVDLFPEWVSAYTKLRDHLSKTLMVLDGHLETFTCSPVAAAVAAWSAELGGGSGLDDDGRRRANQHLDDALVVSDGQHDRFAAFRDVIDRDADIRDGFLIHMQAHPGHVYEGEGFRFRRQGDGRWHRQLYVPTILDGPVADVVGHESSPSAVQVGTHSVGAGLGGERADTRSPHDQKLSAEHDTSPAGGVA